MFPDYQTRKIILAAATWTGWEGGKQGGIGQQVGRIAVIEAGADQGEDERFSWADRRSVWSSENCRAGKRCDLLSIQMLRRGQSRQPSGWRAAGLLGHEVGSCVLRRGRRRCRRENNSPAACMQCPLLVVRSGGWAGRRGSDAGVEFAGELHRRCCKPMNEWARGETWIGELHTGCGWLSAMREMSNKRSERRVTFTKTYNYTITPRWSKERGFVVTSNNLFFFSPAGFDFVTKQPYAVFSAGGKWHMVLFNNWIYFRASCSIIALEVLYILLKLPPRTKNRARFLPATVLLRW